MEDKTLALKVYDAVRAGGSRGRGRSPLGLNDQLEQHWVAFGISNWRQMREKKK